MEWWSNYEKAWQLSTSFVLITSLSEYGLTSVQSDNVSWSVLYTPYTLLPQVLIVVKINTFKLEFVTYDTAIKLNVYFCSLLGNFYIFSRPDQ